MIAQHYATSGTGIEAKGDPAPLLKLSSVNAGYAFNAVQLFTDDQGRLWAAVGNGPTKATTFVVITRAPK